MDVAGLLDDMKERVRTQGATPFVGGGMRGAFLRGLLGLDPAEESTQAQIRAYQTGQALSNSPTPLALAAAPAAIAKAGKAAKAKKPLPREEALETARKNAVEMLGLPESNTAMDRARAMGFDVEAYHGTNRDFQAFSNDMLGAKTGAKSAQKAHFFASNPELSNTYVNTENVNPLPWKAAPPIYEKLINNKQAWKEFNEAGSDAEKWAVLERYGMNYGSGRVMPLMLRTDNPRVIDYKGSQYRDTTYNEQLKAAKKGKKDSVVFKNTYDPGPHEGSNVMSDVYAVFDPSRIRSRFAAFDPKRINDPDLLASLAAFGVGLPVLGLLAEEE